MPKKINLKKISKFASMLSIDITDHCDRAYHVITFLKFALILISWKFFYQTLIELFIDPL